MRHVEFVDTSIVLEILDVPGANQHRADVIRDLETKTLQDGIYLVLPLAAVIEAGNRISQLSDGHVRYTAACRLREMLEASAEPSGPWLLHDLETGQQFLKRLCDGVGDESFESLHQRHVGTGDLTVLAEAAQYRERTSRSGVDVSVWTLDQDLEALAAATT